MNTGIASTIRTVAIIFVTPHVILNAIRMAAKNKQIVSIDISISNIIIYSFCR